MNWLNFDKELKLISVFRKNWNYFHSKTDPTACAGRVHEISTSNITKTALWKEDWSWNRGMFVLLSAGDPLCHVSSVNLLSKIFWTDDHCYYHANKSDDSHYPKYKGNPGLEQAARNFVLPHTNWAHLQQLALLCHLTRLLVAKVIDAFAFHCLVTGDTYWDEAAKCQNLNFCV